MGPREIAHLIAMTKLSSAQLANILGYASARSVRRWQLPESDPYHRRCPPTAIEHLTELAEDPRK